MNDNPSTAGRFFAGLMLAAALMATAALAAPPSARADAASQDVSMASGEVLEIDRKERRVVVNHGPIQSLGMDAMAMEFLVPDPKLLASLRPGDKIRFAAAWKDGDYLITRASVVGRKGSSGRRVESPGR